jgi:hypothetical protein
LGKKPSRLRCCIGPKKTKSALQQTATKGLVLASTHNSVRQRKGVGGGKQIRLYAYKKRFNLLGTMKTGLAQNYLTVP